jgi:hypothetical protein
MKRYHVFTVRVRFVDTEPNWASPVRRIARMRNHRTHARLEKIIARVMTGAWSYVLAFDIAGPIAVELDRKEYPPPPPYLYPLIKLPFDYIDVYGNYRLADGTIAFDAPPS